MTISMISAIESIQKVPGRGDVYKYMRCSPDTIETMKIRRSKIINSLKGKGEVSTHHLIASHDELEKTIRNDLAALVEQGLIKRTMRNRFVFYSAIKPRVSL